MPDNSTIASLTIPTTPMFDVGSLEDKENLNQLLVQLTQFNNYLSLVVNQKDSALYIQQQFLNGQFYFPNPALGMFSTQQPELRQVIRQVFNVGPLPNNGTLTVPHNIAITNIYTFTRIYGCASDTTGLRYIPLPEAFVNGQIVDLAVNGINIVINTNFNASNFNICYVILEWLAD